MYLTNNLPANDLLSQALSAFTGNVRSFIETLEMSIKKDRITGKTGLQILCSSREQARELVTIIDREGLGQQIKAVDEIKVRVGKHRSLFYVVPVAMVQLTGLSIVR